MKLKRIQLGRKKGWRMLPNTIKVDRTTRHGNPSEFGKGEESIQAFTKWLESRPRDELEEHPLLRGYNMACWCPLSGPCHADVLLKKANK
jgi:hypothetical protein